MADNVQLSTNVGTGEVCATDDVGGVQYQRVKLTDGTADSTTVIAAGGGVEANALRVTIASDSTGLLSIDDNGGSLTVDGTVAATQSGSWTIDLGATDNAVLDAIAASLAGTLTIAGAVTNAGTFAVQAAQSGTWTVQPGNTANTTAWLVTGTGGTFPVSGVAAHGAAVVGNPVLVAGENPLGNLVRLQTDTDGDLIVHQHSDPVSLADDVSNTIQVPINEDNAGVLYSPVLGYVFDGTSWDRMRGTSADGLLVNLGANNDVTITSGTVTTVTTLTGGGVAHDAADSGNPIKVGAKASATLSDDTMVANADRTDLTSDLDGAIIVRPQFPLGDLISERVSNTDGASTAFTNFGATASTRNYIYGYSIFRTDAGTTPIYVDFRDGTAGSILWSVVIPPNGGANLSSPVPLFRSTANTALAFDVSAATSTVYISVHGAKSKV